jgi:hypothetical protein
MLPSGLDKPDRFVSPDDIRSLFNGLGLYEKATTGQLDQEVYDEYATPERAGQLRGTVTQIVIYYERLPSGARRPVALVSHYMQPDGQLGASGKPDPKWLRLPNHTIIAVK